MLFKSALVTAASGKLGGLVAGHNRGGPYLRGLGIPTNPNTVAQQTIRGYFSSASSRWGSTLTASERAAWVAYSESLKLANALGDPVTTSGQNAYVRSNMIRRQTGLAFLDTAPIGQGESEPILPDLTAITLADSTSAVPNVINVPLLLDMENQTSDADDRVAVWLSRGPIPSGVEFTNNLPREPADSVAGDAVFPLVVATSQTITLGEVYLLRMIRIDAAGRVSPVSERRITAINVP